MLLLFSLFSSNEPKETQIYRPTQSSCRYSTSATFKLFFNSNFSRKHVETCLKWRVWYKCKCERQRNLYRVPETMPEPFIKNKLKYMVRGLNLIWETAECLPTRLNEKHLLGKGTIEEFSRKRDAEVILLFNANTDLVTEMTLRAFFTDWASTNTRTGVVHW